MPRYTWTWASNVLTWPLQRRAKAFHRLDMRLLLGFKQKRDNRLNEPSTVFTTSWFVLTRSVNVQGRARLTASCAIPSSSVRPEKWACAFEVLWRENERQNDVCF